jgi:hypothetical protein
MLLLVLNTSCLISLSRQLQRVEKDDSRFRFAAFGVDRLCRKRSLRYRGVTASLRQDGDNAEAALTQASAATRRDLLEPLANAEF